MDASKEIDKIYWEIRNDTKELIQSIGVPMGDKSDIDIDRAKQILSQIYENPTGLARDTFLRNKNKLYQIKDQVGELSEIYVELSDEIAVFVLGVLKLHLNNIGMVAHANEALNNSEFQQTTQSLEESTLILRQLSELPISIHIRSEVAVLQEMISEFEQFYKPSKGCFIASFVYGGPKAPEVIMLQKYRDEILSKHLLGKGFIWFYYKVSPVLIRAFSKYDIFKSYSKQLLDYILRKISSVPQNQEKKF